MTQPPPMISVLRDSHDCVGFLRSAGPRGFQAYDAVGQLLGLFQDKQAAIAAITALNSTGDKQMETLLKKSEIFRDSMGRFDRHGKTLSKTAKNKFDKLSNNQKKFSGGRGGYRPGSGRKPGVPNKITKTLKEMILAS